MNELKRETEREEKTGKGKEEKESLLVFERQTTKVANRKETFSHFILEN